MDSSNQFKTDPDDNSSSTGADIDLIIAQSSQYRQPSLVRKHPSTSNLKILSSVSGDTATGNRVKGMPIQQKNGWTKLSFKSRNTSSDELRSPPKQVLSDKDERIPLECSNVPTKGKQKDPTSISGIYRDYPDAAAAVLGENRSKTPELSILSLPTQEEPESMDPQSSSNTFAFNFKKRTKTGFKSIFQKKTSNTSLASSGNGTSYHSSSIQYISKPSLFLEPSLVDKYVDGSVSHSSSTTGSGTRLHPVLASPPSPVQVQRLTASPLRSLNLESEWSHPNSSDSLELKISHTVPTAAIDDMVPEVEQQPEKTFLKQSFIDAKDTSIGVPTPPPTNPPSSVTTPSPTPVPESSDPAPLEQISHETEVTRNRKSDIAENVSVSPAINLSYGKMAELHRELLMESTVPEFSTVTELGTTLHDDLHTDAEDEINHVVPSILSTPSIPLYKPRTQPTQQPIFTDSTIELPEISSSPILAYFQSAMNQRKFSVGSVSVLNQNEQPNIQADNASIISSPSLQPHTPRSQKSLFQVPNRSSSLILLSAAQSSYMSERRPSVTSIHSISAGSSTAAFGTLPIIPQEEDNHPEPPVSTSSSMNTEERRVSVHNTTSPTGTLENTSSPKRFHSHKRSGSPHPLRSPKIGVSLHGSSSTSPRLRTGAPSISTSFRSVNGESPASPRSPRSPISVRSFRSPLSSHAVLPLPPPSPHSQSVSPPPTSYSGTPNITINMPPLAVRTEPHALLNNPNAPVRNVMVESPEYISPSALGSAGGSRGGTLERAAAKIAAHRRSRSDFVTGPLHFGESGNSGTGSFSAPIEQEPPLASNPTVSPSHGKSAKKAKTGLSKKWNYNQSTPNLVSPPSDSKLSTSAPSSNRVPPVPPIPQFGTKKSETNLFSFFSGGGAYRFRNQSSGGLSKTSHGSGGSIATVAVSQQFSGTAAPSEWLGLTTSAATTQSSASASFTSSSSSMVLSDTLLGTGGTEVTTMNAQANSKKKRYSNRRSTVSVSSQDIERLKDLIATKGGTSTSLTDKTASSSSLKSLHPTAASISSSITVPKRGQSLVHSISSRTTPTSKLQIADGDPIPVQWIPLSYSRFGQPWRPQRPLLILNLNAANPDELVLFPKPKSRSISNASTLTSQSSSLASLGVRGPESKVRRKVQTSGKKEYGVNRSDSKLGGTTTNQVMIGDSLEEVNDIDCVPEEEGDEADSITSDAPEIISKSSHPVRDMRLTVEPEFSRRTTSVGAGGRTTTQKDVPLVSETRKSSKGSIVPITFRGKSLPASDTGTTSSNDQNKIDEVSRSPAMTSQMPPTLMAFASQFHNQALQRANQNGNGSTANQANGNGSKFSKKFGKSFLSWKSQTNSSQQSLATKAGSGRSTSNATGSWTGHRAQSEKIAWNQQLYDPVQVAATMGSIALPKDKRGSYDPHPNGRILETSESSSGTLLTRGKSLDLPRERVLMTAPDQISTIKLTPPQNDIELNSGVSSSGIKRVSRSSLWGQTADPPKSPINVAPRKLRPRSISLSFSLTASQILQQQFATSAPEEKTSSPGTLAPPEEPLAMNRRQSTMSAMTPDLASDVFVALSFAYSEGNENISFSNVPEQLEHDAIADPVPPPVPSKDTVLKAQAYIPHPSSSKRISIPNRRKSLGAISSTGISPSVLAASYESNASTLSGAKNRSVGNPRRSSLSFSNVTLAMQQAQQLQTQQSLSPDSISSKPTECNRSPQLSALSTASGSRRSHQFLRNVSPGKSPRSSLQLTPFSSDTMTSRNLTGTEKVKSPLSRLSMSFDRFFTGSSENNGKAESPKAASIKSRKRDSFAFFRPMQIVTDPIKNNSTKSFSGGNATEDEEYDDFDDSASALYSASTVDYGETSRASFFSSAAAATLRRLRTTKDRTSTLSSSPTSPRGSTHSNPSGFSSTRYRERDDDDNKTIASDALSVTSARTTMSRRGFSMRLNKLTSLFKRSSTTLVQSPLKPDQD